ncbi:outer membrane autotransporter barrel, partial [Leisingera sp. MMG025]|nr:outer membrane autotransporter barrel [Leisingera sp. MMG026]
MDNSASAIAASALDVTDNLPAGLVLASPSNAAATCTGGTLTATAGAATLSYTGGTAAAGASCTITADVTSSTAGSYINTTGDLTSSSGNSGTASASLNVIGLTVNTPFTADNILAAAEAAAVTVSGSSTQIEDGRTVTVTVTDSTAAQVSGSASISGNAWSLTLDLSGLAEGALTLTADASDAAGTAANQVSENLTKNAEAPAGYSAAFD